jgi:hypothetical protein
MATPIVRHALVGAGVGWFVFKSLQRGGGMDFGRGITYIWQDKL